MVPNYCREIESYLCRKNDGHLIRVVGPSFELVSRWAADGVPLKVAFRGIDRYFERYYRAGPRRRPVRIDSCEGDVQDVFDEWRRALGLTATVAISEDDSSDENPNVPDGTPGEANDSSGALRKRSLPAHLERVVMRLSSARATGRLGEDADRFIDQLSQELDVARSSAQGVRGEARQALIARLDALDAELLKVVRVTLEEVQLQILRAEADTELAGFRAGMTADAYDRARDAAVNALIRERFGLPDVAFS